MLTSVMGYAQEQLLPEKTWNMNAAFGLGVTPDDEVLSRVSVSSEYGLLTMGNRLSLGVGLLAAYGWDGYTDYNTTTRKCDSNIYQLVPHCLLHITALRKWEFYTGLGAGVQFRDSKEESWENGQFLHSKEWTETRFLPQFVLGTRVQMGNHFGLFLQWEFERFITPHSILSLGATFHF